MIDLNVARVQRDLSVLGFQLMLGQRMAHGTYCVSDMSLEKTVPGAMVRALPTITEDAAQMLMDDLWNAGLRPAQNNDTQGEVEFLRKQIDRIIRNEWSE